MAQDTDSKRRNPRQPRAQRTVEAILDAAAQILRRRGEAEFTTNHVAERAGVSIGTLYQYFKNKDAILVRLSDREVLRLRDDLRAVLAEDRAPPLEHRVRHLVGVLTRFFAQRRQSKRIVLLRLLSALSSGRTDAPFGEIVDEVTGAWNRVAPPEHHLDALSAMVLSQALLGVLRAALILHPTLLDNAELEDRLVRLVLGYVHLPRAAPSSVAHDESMVPKSGPRYCAKTDGP
jgi:AcrR family transcriptional regulator